jgi:hypothetical protein
VDDGVVWADRRQDGFAAGTRKASDYGSFGSPEGDIAPAVRMSIDGTPQGAGWYGVFCHGDGPGAVEDLEFYVSTAGRYRIIDVYPKEPTTLAEGRVTLRPSPTHTLEASCFSARPGIHVVRFAVDGVEVSRMWRLASLGSSVRVGLVVRAEANAFSVLFRSFRIEELATPE